MWCCTLVGLRLEGQIVGIRAQKSGWLVIAFHYGFAVVGHIRVRGVIAVVQGVGRGVVAVAHSHMGPLADVADRVVVRLDDRLRPRMNVMLKEAGVRDRVIYTV